MFTIDQTSQVNQLNYTLEPEMQAQRGSAPNPDILLTTPTRNENLLLPQAGTNGSIREYSRVGDGAHNSRHQPMLPLFMERARQRPQILVRKVTVMGSHVLRYVSRSSNLLTRRQQRLNVQRVRLARIDQHINHGNVYNYDQPDSDWLDQEFETDLFGSRRLRLQHEPSIERQMLQPDIEGGTSLSLFNWRIYLGVLCIIAAQALLKFAFDEFYHMS